MAGKKAKILSDDQVERLLLFASTTRNPLRNRVLILLSLKAGLRAGEIANLTWPMVLDPGGEIGPVLELRNHAAKKKSGRLIAMHPDLRDALAAWGDAAVTAGPVVRSERGRPMTPVSIVNWFTIAYRAIGLAGARPIRGGGHSSPAPRGSFIRPVGRYAMFKFSPVTDPFKRPSGTSTATPTLNAGWWR